MADPTIDGKRRNLTTTNWVDIRLAAENNSPEGAEALETLCRNYLPVLLSYGQAICFQREKVPDLVQEFFLRVISRADLKKADPTRGRLRTFLLTSFKNFVLDEARKNTRSPFFKSELLEEHSTFHASDREFDKEWALRLITAGLRSLSSEYAAKNRLPLFQAIKLKLAQGSKGQTAMEIGMELGMTEMAVRAEIYRLRQRFQEIVRSEIAATLVDQRDIDDEMRHLFAVLYG